MGCSGSRPEREQHFSIVLDNPNEDKGESKIYRHPDCREALLDHIKRWPEVRTVKDLYLKAFKEWANRDFLGTRRKNQDGTYGEYVFKTYAEVEAIVHKIGYAIVGEELAKPEPSTGFRFLGIWAKNREEWAMTEMASTLFKHILLPMYDSLGAEAIKFVFETTGVQTFFTSGDHVDQLINGAAKKDFKSLKTIVSFDPVTKEQVTKAQEAGLRLIDWNELQALGTNKVDYPEIKPSDIYTFCYTSGTTAIPKAAMLDHTNFISCVGGAHESALSPDFITPGNVHISYLPLAHIYERMLFPYFCTVGAVIGYFSGDPLRLPEDIQVLRPTILISVPRIYNKFHDKIKANIAKLPDSKREFAEKALATKLQNLRENGEYTHFLYDMLVTKKMREAMGGRLKICISGAAPLSADVGDFLKTAFCCPILEGYGATETTAPCYLQHKSQALGGNIGAPWHSIECKLVDVPEMNYTSQDRNPEGLVTPRGEICVRGYSIFKGYYKDPENTAAALDKDGWYHTGDIGVMLPNGALKIIDRKKNIFKLAQGEYLAPERVENVYLTHKYVTECWIHGDSFQNQPVAVIVPEKEAIEELAKQKGIQGTYKELLANKQIRDAVLEEINKFGKEQGLKGYELAQNVYLEEQSFVLQGLTTPTMKLKRNDLKKRYESSIKDLYQGK